MDARAGPSEPRRRGACAAHAGPEVLTNRAERKQKTKTKPTRSPTFLCKEIVGGAQSRAAENSERPPPLAHPAPPERGASFPAPGTPLRARSGGRGRARDSFWCFPGTRLCSSVVNKVSLPPARWFASWQSDTERARDSRNTRELPENNNIQKERECKREKHPTTPHQPTAASRWKTGPRPGRRPLAATAAVPRAHWPRWLSVRGGPTRAPRRAGGGGRSRKSSGRVVAAASAASATFNRQQRRGRAAESERPAASVSPPVRGPCHRERGAGAARARRPRPAVPSVQRPQRSVDVDGLVKLSSGLALPLRRFFLRVSVLLRHRPRSQSRTSSSPLPLPSAPGAALYPFSALPRLGEGRGSPWPRRPRWWRLTRTSSRCRGRVRAPGRCPGRSLASPTRPPPARRRRVARPRTPMPPRACPRRPLSTRTS